MAESPTTEKTNAAETHDDHEEGFHTIAGFRVGEKNVPFSVIITFLFIAFIAAISWIPSQGF